MDLSLLIVFAALIIVAMGMVKQTGFVHHRKLECKNMTTLILSVALKQSVASFCVDLINCESNPETDECQLHKMVFTSARISQHQQGQRYHYMLKGINDWCPWNDGYQLLARNGPCIKFNFDRMTWHEANESCSAHSPNSHLVVLDTKEKNDLVKAAGKAIDDQFSTGVWMGLSEREDNVYSWVDGRDVTFTDWSGNDKSAQRRRDCVAFQRSRSWRWSRVTCKRRLHHACEIALP